MYNKKDLKLFENEFKKIFNVRLDSLTAFYFNLIFKKQFYFLDNFFFLTLENCVDLKNYNFLNRRNIVD